MTENSERINLIKNKLINAFNPVNIEVIDESHLHVNHPGAKESGGGHFNISIIADCFEGKSAIERHRMIYVALGETMGTDIHALSISAKTPTETNHLVN